jgi:phage FluMu gp28-like protein
MAVVIRPLSSTIRVVEWEELPASVREVPADFNPLAAGILMAHQVEWLKIKATIKTADKGRRTGITFAEALDDTLLAASRRSAGGMNVFYIGDTKEKGLEFIGYCARFARVIAQAQQQGVSSIEEFLFNDQDEQGNSRQITAYRIRFSSGFQITALSSRPSNIRGLQGKVVIDEAAFHQDVQAVLDAVTALIIWGGRIAIISSQNGSRNPFNQLVKDIEAGKYGTDAVVFRVTFDDAVANGLYERVQYMKGEPATPEGKKAWYTRIRMAYGVRKATMREELDCIPRDGNGVCIPRIWIEEAMPEPREILRLVLGDDFVAMPPKEREAWCSDWIARNLKPQLAQLDKRRQHVFGQDFARHRHFSTIAPIEIGQTLRRTVPFGVEMHRVPTRQQEQILWALIDGLANFRGGAMDATGPGQTLAEYTADKYGSLIHQVTLNRQWYGLWMPKLVQAFEDRMLVLPADANWANDIQAIEEVDGIAMVRKAEAKDVKEPELHRHGDAAVALALGWFSTLNLSGEIDFLAAPKHPRGFDNLSKPRDDDDFSIPEPSAW